MRRRNAERLAWLGMTGLFAAFGVMGCWLMEPDRNVTNAMLKHILACPICTAQVSNPGLPRCPEARRLDAAFRAAGDLAKATNLSLRPAGAQAAPPAAR